MILDNAPRHPPILQHHNLNVKIIFLPPNKPVLLQMMDQGVKATFKAHYLHYTFEMIIKATDRLGASTVKEFGRQFNILDALQIIKKNIEKNMKGVWKKLSHQLVNDFDGFQDLETNFKMRQQKLLTWQTN